MHARRRDVLARVPRERVVQRHRDRRVIGHKTQSQTQHHETDLLRVPHAAAEVAVVTADILFSDGRRTHHTRDGVLADAEHPAVHHGDEAPIARRGEAVFECR